MAKQTATPAKRASKPIKGTPRPKAATAKSTPASIQKKSTSKSASASKARRSVSKSARKSSASNANNRSSVSPIKEQSFTGAQSSNETSGFKTPVKPASAAKRRPASSARKTTATSSRSASKSTRPASRNSSRPPTPSKAAAATNQIGSDSTLANSILGLREYCSVI